ncbi:MAG: RIP metalloprotease RseP [Clostridiales bacterium]|jgi:regulator of sigma E protease|nr:RIP metalloprotease RseP [Clostridiales bacterium]
MINVIGILVAVLVFSILIFTHELGHFTAAKLNGIYVKEFNMGMGPKLLSRRGKNGETLYSLRAFPIGGSCLMKGEDEADDDPRSFSRKPVWRRMTVIFAGPLMNFVTAMIVFAIVFMSMGIMSDANIIGDVTSGDPAQQAGLLAGDRVLAINGASVASWSGIVTEINHQVSATPGESLNMTIQRQGQEQDIAVKPFFDEEANRWRIGITASTEQPGLFAAMGLGVTQSYIFTKTILVGLVQMITGKVAPDVAGPVGIINIVRETVRTGWQNILGILGILSVNLAVVNLLPLPALDGCRLVFLAAEGIRRKPFNREREGMVHFIGLMLLFGLMIVITFSDIRRLFTG